MNSSKPAKPGTCTEITVFDELILEMNGAALTGTPIAVDYWRCKKSPSSKVFFLSHAHSDHTSGLSSTWRYPIYCSEVTGKIVVAKCGVKQSLIRALLVGNGHIIPLDESGKETMTVTLIDANHCPGATMFLFEGYFGRFLYTGDFRYCPSMFSNTVLEVDRPVDRLYLDNTYNSPENDFPGEDDCKVKIMEVLAEFPFSKVVFGMHKLGKEDLLEDIAKFCEETIQVTPERMSMIELLDCKNVFTLIESRIRVVPVHTITMGTVEQWNDEFPTIVIIPSAIFRSQRRSCIANHPNVFIIPYSSHSSYKELIEFVKQVRPRKVIPIVQPSLSKRSEAAIADMSNFDHSLDPTPPASVNIPSSVQTYMHSNLSVIEVQRSSLRKRPSITDKRGMSKSAKGVLFEDASEDGDSDSNQNIKGNSTANVCDKDMDMKADNSAENLAKSIWDVRTHPETSNVFDKFNRLKDKLSVTVSEKSIDMSQDQDPDLGQDSLDDEPKLQSPKWQVCHETFYTKPKWTKRSPRKKSQHICDHAQSGKSCLCKYLVKEPKENLTSVRSWDDLHGTSGTCQPKVNINKPVSYNSKDVTNSTSIVSDEPCTSSSKPTVKMHCNTSPLKGGQKMEVPSILSVDRSSRRDHHVKCYSAIQNFYKKVKTCSPQSTCR